MPFGQKSVYYGNYISQHCLARSAEIQKAYATQTFYRQRLLDVFSSVWKLGYFIIKQTLL
jgi:hypothetical protein